MAKNKVCNRQCFICKFEDCVLSDADLDMEQKGKEKIKQYNQRYYAENKEKILKQKKEYAQRNKAKILLLKKIYYQENRIKKLEYQAEYAKKHREEIKQRMHDWYLRRKHPYQDEVALLLKENRKKWKDKYYFLSQAQRQEKQALQNALKNSLEQPSTH